MHTCGEVHPAHGKFLEESAPMPLSRETTSTARLMCELRPLDLVLSLLGPHKARIDDQGSLRYRRTRRPLGQTLDSLDQSSAVQVRTRKGVRIAVHLILTLSGYSGYATFPRLCDPRCVSCLRNNLAPNCLNSDKAFLTHERGRPAERYA